MCYTTGCNDCRCWFGLFGLCWRVVDSCWNFEASEIDRNLIFIESYPCESLQTAPHRTSDSKSLATCCSKFQDCTNRLVEFDRWLATEMSDYLERILVN